MEKMNLTRKEAAALMGISTVSLDAFRHRERNPLPFFLVGNSKVLIPRASLEKWAEDEAERTIRGVR